MEFVKTVLKGKKKVLSQRLNNAIIKKVHAIETIVYTTDGSGITTGSVVMNTADRLGI